MQQEIMTTEEKARAYDKAIERANEYHCDGIKQCIIDTLEYVFPELRDSEDERIRNVFRGWIYSQPASFFDNGISKEEILAWLEKQGGERQITYEEICNCYGIPDIGEFSDGYHTFNSLYKQRMILFAVLVKTYKDKAWKSWKHEDGLDCFGGGWFIVGIDTPAGTYTYHYEAKDWGMFDCQILDKAKHWDGHDEFDVERLFTLLEKQGEIEEIKGNEGKISPKIDGFDAELNALLKKYEHLPKEELAECLSFYLGVVQGNECDEEIVEAVKNASILDLIDEQKPKWSEEDDRNLRDIIIAVHYVPYQTSEDEEFRANWLKSLKKRMEEWTMTEIEAKVRIFAAICQNSRNLCDNGKYMTPKNVANQTNLVYKMLQLNMEE